MEDCHFENLPQQAIYSVLLKWGVRLGLGMLVTFFCLYIFHLLPPVTEIQAVTHHWQLPLQEYLAQTSSPHGWQWLQYWNRGDYLNFAAIVWLPLLSAGCYFYLAITFLLDRDFQYFFIALAELTLITISAGNLLHFS